MNAKYLRYSPQKLLVTSLDILRKINYSSGVKKIDEKTKSQIEEWEAYEIFTIFDSDLKASRVVVGDA